MTEGVTASFRGEDDVTGALPHGMACVLQFCPPPPLTKKDLTSQSPPELFLFFFSNWISK